MECVTFDILTLNIGVVSSSLMKPNHIEPILNPNSGFHIWIKGEKILGFSKTNILDLVTKFGVFHNIGWPKISIIYFIFWMQTIFSESQFYPVWILPLNKIFLSVSRKKKGFISPQIEQPVWPKMA